MNVPQIIAIALNTLGTVMFAFGLCFSLLGEAGNSWLATTGAFFLWVVGLPMFFLGEYSK